MEEITLRIDNDRADLDAALGEPCLSSHIHTINYPDHQTPEDFARWHPHGKYLLIVPSQWGLDMLHVIVLVEGELKSTDSGLLKMCLVNVQQITSEGRVN